MVMPKKILIADDNVQIRFLIRSLVESAEFTVVGEAGNGKDAVEKAKQLSPDLILLDLAMPVVNGAEAAAILNDQLPAIPIILFTLHQDRSLANHLKVAKIIGKPDGMTKLLDSIRDVLRLSGPASTSARPLDVPINAPLNGSSLTDRSKPPEKKPPEK
jgi:DNA-binding NarL/FixJ family response regulator